MLSRLSVKGFKSFADPTTLRLGPGVNVIVGPNGSGKSNLAEAILWALGEQRAGRLRAGGMGEVLYAGGQRRPAAPLAEVTLALEADPERDAGPAEMEASRRLTRAGDALYRLAGGACRLLDLQEALAGRGLGPDALAVIRQGQVEALCTSTPEQRRAMVDAAAGVAVAKRRRRRAEQKLARVDENLVRARDLAGEVNARAQSLARQARAAERAAELDAQITAAGRAVQAGRARAAAQAHEAARGEHRRLADLAQEATRALERARAAQRAAESARAEAAEGVRVASERVAALRGGAERIAGRVELARERLAAAEREQRRQAERREQARARMGQLRTEEAEAAAQVAQTAERAEAAQAALAEAEAADLRGRAERRAAEDAAAAAAAARSAAERAVADAAGRRERATAALAAARQRHEAMGALTAFEVARDRAERREEVSSGRVERWSRRAADAGRVAADAAAVRAGADERLRQARAAARSLAPPSRPGDRGPAVLGDGLEVEPGAERAVAAALGARLDAVAAADVAGARAALEQGARRAVVPARARARAAAPPGAVRAWELVTGCHDSAREHLERLLSDAWVVDDLADLPDGMEGVAVTRDGFALHPRDGVVSRADEGWTRRALHRRAVDAEEAAAAEAGRAAQDAERAAAAAAAVVRRRRAAERAVARASAALAGARAAVDRRAAEAAELDGELERLRVASDAATAASTEAAAELERAAAQATQAAAAAAQVRTRGETAARAFRDAGSAAADARAAAAAAKTRQAEAAARITAVGAVAEEPEPNRSGLELGARAVAALEAAAGALAPVVSDASTRRDELARAARDHDAGVGRARQDVDTAERAAAAASEAAHAAEVAAAVAGERAAEAGDPPPADLELPDPEEAAQALAALERRRAGIGAVNPLAAAEREELAEREAEMHEHIADLESTAERLRTHMAELDAAVAAGFDALFQSLCERFEEVCGLLFPGGRGQLRAVLDDEGEAGIEIEVVPAGKRPRSLALLSGGERSLVALGFCLALAMARPAPFYLLDEVEAALDDVNLRRFLAVVRRLADDGRQFLLITHQQPTVEIADTLFGVTMGAEGVSQVLSRRLRRDEGRHERRDAAPALRAISGGRGA